jgi:hypothetical protein
MPSQKSDYSRLSDHRRAAESAELMGSKFPDGLCVLPLNRSLRLSKALTQKISVHSVVKNPLRPLRLCGLNKISALCGKKSFR